MKPTPVVIPDDFKLLNCAVQTVSELSTGSGIYCLDHMEHRQMDLGSYRELAMEEKYQQNLDYDQIQQLFWQNLHEITTIRPMPMEKVPIYAVDNECTCFPDDFGFFNLNRMSTYESVLHLNRNMFGINTTFVYYSMPFATFALHHEDGNTASLSRHHSGAARTWISVPSSNAAKLEAVVRSWTPESITCDNYSKHKAVLIPPEVLRKHDIDFGMVNIQVFKPPDPLF